MSNPQPNCVRLFKLNFSLSLLSLCFSGSYIQAAPGAKCLNHLGGGGFGDFECYMSATRDVEARSAALAAKIEAKIRRSDAGKLHVYREYIAVGRLKTRFCGLIRDGQRLEGEDRSHIRYYDVMYAECIYKESVKQSDYLSDLADAWEVDRR